MKLEVTLEAGRLVISIPVMDPPEPTKSEKNLLVASTRGNVLTTTMVNGKPLTISVNAYIKA